MEEKQLTNEEKLDLILDRCKRNLSTIEKWKDEWIEICKKVAHNNTDTECPLFQTYIRHLKEIDHFIFLDFDGILKATVTGLMFEGYANKLIRTNQENINSSAYDGRMETYQKRLLYWTTALTVGTWLAAIGGFGLLVWESRHFLLRFFGCSS